MRILMGIAWVALLGALPSTAMAQNYFGSSTGFPVGDKSRIHTSLDLGMLFDSNAQRFDVNDPLGMPGADGPKDSWRATVRPRIDLNVPGTSLKLDLGMGLQINRTFANPSSVISGTTFGGDVQLAMTIGSPDSLVAFRVSNALVRTPVILEELGTIQSDEFRFKEWNDRLDARLTLRPGGRALEFDFGYLFYWQQYDADSLDDQHRHGGVFEARWKFFPKTAFVFRGEVTRFIPFEDGEGGFAGTRGGTPIAVTAGAVGQVTAKLSAELTAGYGDTLSDDPNLSIRGPIGNAILTYDFTPSTSLSIGYRRHIQPIVVLNSYSADAPFLRFQTAFGRLILSLYGTYEYRVYESQASDTDEATKSAHSGVAEARGEYWFFEWLNAGIRYRFLAQNPTSDQVPTPGEFLLQNYVRHQVMLNVGFRY